MFKVYIYKYEKIYPITLLVSTTSSDIEQEIYDKYYSSFYEILLIKNIIDVKSILVFCNFKNNLMKKQLQIQGSVESDKDILNTLESNIKNVEFVTNKIINEYKTNFILEIVESILQTENPKIKSYINGEEFTFHSINTSKWSDTTGAVGGNMHCLIKNQY